MSPGIATANTIRLALNDFLRKQGGQKRGESNFTADQLRVPGALQPVRPNGTREDVAPVAKCTKRKPAQAGCAPPRNPTKLEKTIFNLRHPEHADEAQRLMGQHFLALSSEDQDDIRQIVRERQDREIRARERPSNDHPPRREWHHPCRDMVWNGQTIDSQRKEFGNLLLNLSFTDRALDRYLSLRGHRRLAALEQFRQLDTGNVRDKHHVPDTRPCLFQRDGGCDFRVYYRQDGAPNHYLIHLIGTKTTQKKDYRSMQRGSRSGRT